MMGLIKKYPIYRVVGAIDSDGRWWKIEVKKSWTGEWEKYYYKETDGSSWYIRFTDKNIAIEAALHLSTRISALDDDIEETRQDSVDEEENSFRRIKVLR